MWTGGGGGRKDESYPAAWPLWASVAPSSKWTESVGNRLENLRDPCRVPCPLGGKLQGEPRLTAVSRHPLREGRGRIRGDERGLVTPPCPRRSCCSGVEQAGSYCRALSPNIRGPWKISWKMMKKLCKNFKKMFAPKEAFLLLPFFHGFADGARG